jgi:hypothetical protein
MLIWRNIKIVYDIEINLEGATDTNDTATYAGTFRSVEIVKNGQIR